MTRGQSLGTNMWGSGKGEGMPRDRVKPGEGAGEISRRDGFEKDSTVKCVNDCREEVKLED